MHWVGASTQRMVATCEVYRQFITIDGEETCEYDFEQMNPQLPIHLGKDLGKEDAYSRVFGEEHRDVEGAKHQPRNLDLRTGRSVGRNYETKS